MKSFLALSLIAFLAAGEVYGIDGDRAGGGGRTRVKYPDNPTIINGFNTAITQLLPNELGPEFPGAKDEGLKHHSAALDLGVFGLFQKKLIKDAPFESFLDQIFTLINVNDRLVPAYQVALRTDMIRPQEGLCASPIKGQPKAPVVTNFDSRRPPPYFEGAWICISLGHFRSIPEELVQEEIVGVLTHEIGHLFEGVSHRQGNNLQSLVLGEMGGITHRNSTENMMKFSSDSFTPKNIKGSALSISLTFFYNTIPKGPNGYLTPEEDAEFKATLVRLQKYEADCQTLRYRTDHAGGPLLGLFGNYGDGERAIDRQSLEREYEQLVPLIRRLVVINHVPNQENE